MIPRLRSYRKMTPKAGTKKMIERMLSATHSLQAVSETLERHSGHGEITGRMAAQDALGESDQAVPEGSFEPRR